MATAKTSSNLEALPTSPSLAQTLPSDAVLDALKKAGKKFKTINRKTLQIFQAYGWPGNVRALQNVIERAVILSDGDTVSVDETWLKQEPPPVATPTVALNGALLRQEKEMIEAALAESRSRISGLAGAAAKLGLPTRTLDSKIKRLGIDKFRFKVQQSS